MDSTGKQGGHDLQVCENRLMWTRKRKDIGSEEAGRVKSTHNKNHYKETSPPSLPLKQGWRGGRVWTAPRQLHGCCCDKLRLHGNDPLRSSWRWQRCPLGSRRFSEGLAPVTSMRSIKTNVSHKWADSDEQGTQDLFCHIKTDWSHSKKPSRRRHFTETYGIYYIF